MAASSTPIHTSLPAEDRPAPKRRKLRKGTVSCWECKRRKIRCVFEAPSSTVCNGCKRRGAKCTSQEFDEESESATAGDNQQIGARLHRVEELLENLTSQLARHASDSGSSTNNSDLPTWNGRGLWNNAEPSNPTPYNLEFNPAATITTTAPFELDRPGHPSWVNNNIIHSHVTEALGGLRYLLEPSLPAITISPNRNIQDAATRRDLSLALLRVWPSQSDRDHLHGVLSTTSGFRCEVHAHYYSCFLGQDKPSPHDILQLPPAGSHPVLIARKLLSLAIYLQGVVGLGARYCQIMYDVVDTVHKLVTSNDELVTSVEGIECLMVECLYQNTGNLHQAWLAVRRALTFAQYIGLHRQADWASLPVLNPEIRVRVSPGSLWFRIIHIDRYLSLMLGLPQGSLENSFAAPNALKSCEPLERLQRVAAVAAGRIMQSKGNSLCDLDATQKIDKLLLKASESMPAQWWLIPDIEPSTEDEVAIAHQSVRVLGHFMYYSLLAHLHLPYLLAFTDDPKYNYNKITAVNASRELLARFVCYRSMNTTAFHCRDLNFVAFIASTALCLAHIRAHQHQLRANSGIHSSDTIFDHLRHQRRSNLGMVQCVLRSVEYMANTSSIAVNITTVLKQLLVIELEAAGGTNYSISFTPGDGAEKLGLGGEVGDGGDVLCISLPHFGTTKIGRRPGIESILLEPPAPQERVSITSSLGDYDSGTAALSSLTLPSGQHDVQRPPTV